MCSVVFAFGAIYIYIISVQYAFMSSKQRKFQQVRGVNSAILIDMY